MHDNLRTSALNANYDFTGYESEKPRTTEGYIIVSCQGSVAFEPLTFQSVYGREMLLKVKTPSTKSHTVPAGVNILVAVSSDKLSML